MKKNEKDKKKIFSLIKRLKEAKSIRNLNLSNNASLEQNQRPFSSVLSIVSENQQVNQNSFSIPKTLSETALENVKKNVSKPFNQKNSFKFLSKSDKEKSTSLKKKFNLSTENKQDEKKKESSKKITKEEQDINEINCSICLRENNDPALCNECLHCFCFTCIQQWSEQSNQCPVCRTVYSSILHNIRSDTEYNTIPVNPRRQINEFQIILPFRRNLLQLDRAINSMMDINRFQILQPGNNMFQTIPLNSNNARRRSINNEVRLTFDDMASLNRVSFKHEPPNTTNYSFRSLVFEDPDDSFIFIQNSPLTQTENFSINRNSNSLRRPKRNAFNFVRQFNAPFNNSFENFFDDLFNSSENTITREARIPINNLDSFLDQVLLDFNQVNRVRYRNSSPEIQGSPTNTLRTNFDNLTLNTNSLRRNPKANRNSRLKRNTQIKRISKRSKSKKKK